MDGALPAVRGLGLALAPVTAAALLAAFAHRARSAALAGVRRPRAAGTLEIVCAAGALALLVQLAASPPPDLASAAGDPRLLCASALAGPGLAWLAAPWRVAVVCAASLGLVGYLAGPFALGTNLALLLPAYACVRHVAPARPRLAALLQSLLFAGALAGLFALRLHHGAAALAAWSLFAFTAMRHVSFAADAPQGPTPTLSGYLLFLFFFPTCQGAMEVWSEFRPRNLAGEPLPAVAAALWRVVTGSVLVLLALQLDASMDRILSAPTWLATWGEILRAFVRSALAVTGLWASFEGGALFLGFRLHPNFRGILLAESPSAFWRAWRGTMTNWLIHYVYVPLGGNRRAHARNVVAAFAVSGAWHVAGTAMLHGAATTLASLLPVIAWALFSCLGVVIHGALRARRPVPPRTGASALAVRALKIGSTWLYGSATVTLLDLSLGDPERFALFLRRISGIG